jgi:hypothetical protein
LPLPLPAVVADISGAKVIKIKSKKNSSGAPAPATVPALGTNKVIRFPASENTKIDFNLPIYRRFHSIEEQNNWFLASDKPILSFYLSPNIITKSFQNIPSPFGYGEVLQTGFVDTNMLLNEYHHFLHSNNQLKEETFQYDQIQFENNWMQYNDIKTKRIVFAEGFGNQYNPFFNYLPLDGTKGEILIIKAPDLAIDFILNTSVFFLPLGNNFFKVGATYNWNDKSSSLTHEGKNELVQKIKDSISCSFEVVEHYAGIRPTVNDRRPLLGRHPRYENLFVLNGMGTRGVMLAPILAEELYLYIEENRSLDKSIDIIRYLKFFK